MAGRSDIEAGRAFVRLTLDNSKFLKGLRSAGDRLKDFGKGVTVLGGIVSAAGAAITAPIAAAVKEFLSTGDALDKMRQRTGISVEALSELAHAAEQSGTSLEEVEVGVKKMQRTLTDAANGSKSAREDFERLGLSVEQLASMSPEDQFNEIAKAIGGLEDPTKRAAAAQEIFGRSGTKMLPMIEDYEALRAEAQALGFTMSGEAAADAVKLGDALANLWKTIKFGGIAIATALVKPLQEIVDKVQKVSTTILKWVKANSALVISIAKIGAGLLAAGAVITAIGVSIAGLGVVLSGMATAFGVIGTALGVLLSPLGIITAALIGGVIAWAKWTDSGKRAVAAVTAFVAPLLQTFRDTFKGIADAVMGGDLQLAGQIAIQGLKTVLLQGVAGIASAVGGAFGDFLGKIGTQLVSGDFKGAWDTAMLGIATAWDKLMSGITSAFASAVKFVVGGMATAAKFATDIWAKATTAISDSILSLAKKFPKLGEAMGMNVAGSQKISDKDRKELEEKLKQVNQAIGNAEKSGTGKSAIVTGGAELDLDTLRERKRMVEGQLAGGPTDILAETQGLASQQIQGIADGITASIDELDQGITSAVDAMAQRAEANAETTAKPLEDGASAAQDAADAAKKELDRLSKLAADKRAAEAAAAGKKPPGGGHPPGSEGEPVASSAAGTFSAAAAGLMGGGGPMAETAKNTAKIAQNTDPKNQKPPTVQLGGGKGGVGGAGLPELKPAEQPGPMGLEEVKRRLQRNLAAQSQGLSQEEIDAVNQEMTPEEMARIEDTDRKNLSRSQAAIEEAKRRLEEEKRSAAQRIKNMPRGLQLGGPQPSIEDLRKLSGGGSTDTSTMEKILQKIHEEQKNTRRAIENEVFV